MNIPVNVPDNKIGDWSVESFTVDEAGAKFHNLREQMHGSFRFIEPGTYKKLCYQNQIIMSNTPAEIRDHEYFIHIAEGNILINGLGLGVVIAGLLQKDNIKSITVIEKSSEVIQLVAPTYTQVSEKITVIHEDAFKYKPQKGMKYEFVWHDIWADICADNLPEMIKLHRKYGRYCNWQGSWCRAECERYR